MKIPSKHCRTFNSYALVNVFYIIMPIKNWKQTASAVFIAIREHLSDLFSKKTISNRKNEFEFQSCFEQDNGQTQALEETSSPLRHRDEPV